jgi:hypothetical protein
MSSTLNQNNNNNHNTNTKGLVSSSDHSNYSSFSVLIHNTKQISLLSIPSTVQSQQILPRSESRSDQLEDRTVLLENFMTMNEYLYFGQVNNAVTVTVITRMRSTTRIVK